MIIREIGIRHARRALAHPVARQACQRAFITEPTTTTATPTSFPDLAAQPQSSQLPTIFTSNAKLSTRPKKAAKGEEPDRTAELYYKAKQLKREIGKVGTKVKSVYRPGDIFLNPPGPKDVTLELLMASQAHMGHNTSLWNPANARYIMGIRNGIHIISLEETAAHLRRAARVVEEVAYNGGLILFVGTRRGQAKYVTQAARLARGCHLFSKWAPGSITNSEVILDSQLVQIVDEHDKRLEGFEEHIAQRRALVPDLVVCLNPLENFVLLHECALANVPTIGVIDTNTEPTWVTYAIPANDDSLRTAAVISSVLGRAGEAGNKRRLEKAKEGHVTWETPRTVADFLFEKRRAEAAKTKEEGQSPNEGGSSPSFWRT